MARIPLEDLSDKNHKNLDKAYISFIETKFFDLILTSSVTTRPSLLEFIQSLELLKVNKRSDFKKAIRAAKVKFNQALAQQQRLNDYLDELEKAHTTSLNDYRLIIKAYEFAAKKRKMIFPLWHQYLDELEERIVEVSLP